jgi:hypothetical protein
MIILLIVLGILGAGTATFFFWIKPRWIDRIDLGPGTTSLAWIGVNISAGDLLDASTAADRLTIYLDELIRLGYSREIRVILTPEWGQIVYDHWWPIIKAKGFKALVILGQEKRDSADIADQSIAWATKVLPLIRDELVGVQIVNEQAYFFAPNEYVSWHRKMAPLVRSLVPGVPIVAGDFGHADGRNGIDQWERLVRQGFWPANDTYDVVSLHLTRINKEGELKQMIARLKTLHSSAMHYWVTEGDWGHLPFLNSQGLTTDKIFLYSWNGSGDGLELRPGGVLM